MRYGSDQNKNKKLNTTFSKSTSRVTNVSYYTRDLTKDVTNENGHKKHPDLKQQFINHSKWTTLCVNHKCLFHIWSVRVEMLLDDFLFVFWFFFTLGLGNNHENRYKTGPKLNEYITQLYVQCSGRRAVFYCAEYCAFKPNMRQYFEWSKNYCSESGHSLYPLDVSL